MKKAIFTLLVVFVTISLLSGCNRKHGMEGEYMLAMTSTIPEFAEGMENVLGLLGQKNKKVVLGTSFLEIDGIRHDFDRIHRKKSGSDEYLIFEKEDTVESWRIEKDGRLVQTSGGLMGYSLVPLKTP